MATLTTNVSMADLEAYYGSVASWSDLVTQANSEFSNNLETALNPLDLSGPYIYYYDVHTSTNYGMTAVPMDGFFDYLPVVVFGATGSGFSYNLDGSFNELDRNFVINSLRTDVLVGAMAELQFTTVVNGNLTVASGALSYAAIDALTVTAAHGGGLSLTGPMSFDGTSLVGDSVALNVILDVDPTTEGNHLVEFNASGALSEDLATGASGTMLKTLGFFDGVSGHELSFTGLQVDRTTLDVAPSFWAATGAASRSDTVRAESSFVLPEAWENLTLTGAGDYSGTGNDLANVIKGNSGRNALKGGSGRDTLIGNRGRDALTGGGGADTFKFVTAQDGTDTIKDFVSGTDKIAVVSSNFGNLATGTLASGRFVSNLTGAAGDSTDRFIFETDTGVLRYDADGTGPTAAVSIARLNTAIRASDILVSAS